MVWIDRLITRNGKSPLDCWNYMQEISSLFIIVRLECRSVAPLQHERGTGVIAGGDLGSRYWELLIWWNREPWIADDSWGWCLRNRRQLQDEAEPLRMKMLLGCDRTPGGSGTTEATERKEHLNGRISVAWTHVIIILTSGQNYTTTGSPCFFCLSEPVEEKQKSGVGRICLEFFLMSEQSEIWTINVYLIDLSRDCAVG